MDVKTTDSGWALSGMISFSNVSALLARGAELIAQNSLSKLTVDFAAVSHTDHCGLALLLAWLKYAKAAGKTLSYSNVPTSLLKTAEVCGVSALLPLAQSTTHKV